jgi:biopolymer transport protein ExbB
MFMHATLVVKVVMIGLLLASALSWTLLIVKMVEFAGLNRKTDQFLEAFRGARSIQDMGRIASSEEFAGQPAGRHGRRRRPGSRAVASGGPERRGEHRRTTIGRAQSAVAPCSPAWQAPVRRHAVPRLRRLGGPFIGLFGTVYGIMSSFIGIAESNTTNLAVVAPGIAEALLATGIGLFAAIPSVIFYNYFQVRIAAYGTRTEGFVAELLNAVSRQLDKGV